MPTENAEGHRTGYFKSVRGYGLFYQVWEPAGGGQPVLIVHGGGEHSGRYEETARRLTRHGFTVYAPDLQGHGRSPGIRGHVRRFDDYLDDFDTMIGLVTERSDGRAPFVLGHSLGGLIATYAAVRAPGTIRALALTSPLWGLALKVPLWKHLIGYCLAPLWPSLTLSRPNSTGYLLSHDPTVQERWLNDPLVHRMASTGLYVEARKRLRQLPRVLPRLTEPVLLLLAGDDGIASTVDAKALFPLIGSADKRLIVYEGYYHEILNEVGRDAVASDLVGWLTAHLA